MAKKKRGIPPLRMLSSSQNVNGCSPILPIKNTMQQTKFLSMMQIKKKKNRIERSFIQLQQRKIKDYFN